MLVERNADLPAEARDAAAFRLDESGVSEELVNEPWIFPPTETFGALIAETFRAHGLKVPK